MPDVIETAASGRSKCRGCQSKIEKGELRFGDAVPNPFGEGEAMHWYHLQCAAEKRPENFAKALAESELEIPERAQLTKAAELGTEHPRLSRIARLERASSGRSRCQACHELIEKDALRLVLERIEDGMMSGAGFIHVACCKEYAGTTEGIAERVRRTSPHLTDADFAELDARLPQS